MTAERTYPTIPEGVRNVIERVVFLPVRLGHWARTRQKNKVRALAREAVRNTLERATHLNLSNVKTVFNVGFYVLLLDQDIADFTDNLMYATGDRRRAFIAKHEALLLYEAAEDLPQLLGAQFRVAAKAIGASDDQIARLNSVSSGLNRFWKEHREFLGTIRNALAAHREHDSLRYAESLDQLKPLEVMERAAELSVHLNGLVQVLTEVALLTADTKVLLRDFLTSKRDK